MQEGPATDKALSALADAQSTGEATFSDRGSTETIRTIERPMKGSGAETLRFQSNSERLTDLAKQRQREDKISFGEALSQVAAENPELTLRGTTINFGGSTPAKRPMSAAHRHSIELNELECRWAADIG